MARAPREGASRTLSRDFWQRKYFHDQRRERSSERVQVAVLRESRDGDSVGVSRSIGMKFVAEDVRERRIANRKRGDDACPSPRSNAGGQMPSLELSSSLTLCALALPSDAF